MVWFAFRRVCNAFCNPWINFIVRFYAEFSFWKTAIINLPNDFCNFSYDSLGLSKPLTASQEVWRNRHLNVVFELSFIICLCKHLFFGGLSELIELLRLKAYVLGK